LTVCIGKTGAATIATEHGIYDVTIKLLGAGTVQPIRDMSLPVWQDIQEHWQLILLAVESKQSKLRLSI